MLSARVRWLFRAILSLYRYAARCALRYTAPPASQRADQRVVTGEAWDEFCETLKAAGGVLLAPGAPTDPFNQAEGYRYLSRLVRAGLENFLECADVNAPRLCSIANGARDAPVKLGSDNPDNLYENATIDGRLEYLVTGTRGSVAYLGFGTQSGQYGTKGGLSTIGYLESDQLTYIDGKSAGPNARFEIILSEIRPANAKNWLPLRSDPPHGLFIARQTFGDRSKEIPAKLSIECIGGMAIPRTLTPAALDEGLQSASVFVAGASAMFAKWANEFQSTTNQLPLFDQERSNRAGGDPNIRYYHSYWRLKPEEALVIRARPPACRFWNFQLNNHWMESLDYRYHPVHTNSFLARPDNEAGEAGSDRPQSFTIIIAHVDPNARAGQFVGNWISTVGHGCGTMCFRWVAPQVSDERLPHPHAALVNLDEFLNDRCDHL